MRGLARPGPALVLAGVLLCLPSASTSASASVPDLSAQSGSRLDLRIDNDATVVVVGLGDAALSRAAAFSADDWRKLLQVVARDPDRSAAGADLPPLLGHYELDGSTLRFTPRFPPAPGLVVEARFDVRRWRETGEPTAGPESLTADLVVPRPGVEPTTQVEAVYPATDTVPANLLRFYVHFSAPMSARHVLPHVNLLDQDGDTIDTAFVEVEGGLWDPSRTRLTLFVHPGRVKRGVGPSQALGPVLEDGRSYTLRIAKDATDDFGRRLAAAYEHAFRVGPEDQVSPDPKRWTLTPPASPEEPLRVDLAEPADVALLQRMPVVADAAGNLVEGVIDVSPDGASFEFRSASNWVLGEYELRVPLTLEDSSGNRVGRRFEEASASYEPGGRSAISRSFAVR